MSALLLSLALGTGAAVHVPVERYRLPNGLSVVLHEDHHLPVVVVDTRFAVGSKDERPGRTGFAHLFEHLMFMGTPEVPNGVFDRLMESAGGANNASTSEDATNYYESGPSNLLETFLWLEADRLAHLPEGMTAEKLALQRDVVRNERRQTEENRPYGVRDLKLPELLYPAAHPYHHPVIGSHDDLNAATLEDVRAFFKEFYVPANASLVVSGDFVATDARKLIARYYAGLPASPAPAHAAPTPLGQPNPERVVLEDDVTLEQLTLAWHSPALFAPGDAEADLLAVALGEGPSSRLYRVLVHDLHLAESVEVQQDSLELDSRWTIVATAQAGHTADELERVVRAELARLAKEPVSGAELERARAQLETQLLRNVEPPAPLALQLNLFEHYRGDAGLLEKELLARYDAVTPARVAEVAKALLAAPAVNLVVTPRKRREPAR